MTHKRAGDSILKGVPKGTSSLVRADRLGKRVSRMGFDWPEIAEVFKKLDEEVEELREAVALKNQRRIREEIGDLLFVAVNIARFLHVDPEDALEKTLKKFTLRFDYVEQSLRKSGKSLRQSNLAEMDQLWEEAKRKEKR